MFSAYRYGLWVAIEGLGCEGAVRDGSHGNRGMAQVSLEPFIRRLKSHSDLSAADIKAVSALPSDRRTISTGHFIVREQGDHSLCHVLLSGAVFSHKVGGDGRRQVLSLSFPGELLNLESLFFDRADQNIQVLRDANIASFPCHPLITLMFEQPAIGKALFRESLIKASIARQWMAGAGMELPLV